jgi:hypothetical protein
MTFADIPSGASVFVDANVFVSILHPIRSTARLVGS